MTGLTRLIQKKHHPRQIGPLPPLPDFPADLPDPLPFAPSEDLPFPCQVAVKGMRQGPLPSHPRVFLENISHTFGNPLQSSLLTVVSSKSELGS